MVLKGNRIKEKRRRKSNAALHSQWGNAGGPAKQVKRMLNGDFIDMAELLKDNMEIKR